MNDGHGVGLPGGGVPSGREASGKHYRKHIRVGREARLVASEREDRHILYCMYCTSLHKVGVFAFLAIIFWPGFLRFFLCFNVPLFLLLLSYVMFIYLCAIDVLSCLCDPIRSDPARYVCTQYLI